MKLQSKIALLLMLFAAMIARFQGQGNKSQNDSEQPPKSVAQLQLEATEIMRKQVGTWKSRRDILDAKGNVTQTIEGTETISFAIEDRVLKVESEIPEQKTKSITLKFFKPAIGKFHFVSVDQSGVMWTFHEEVGLDDSWSDPHADPHADPHVNADKTKTHLRFTTLRKTDNEIDVVMESSSDQKAWTKIFNQYQVRQ